MKTIKLYIAPEKASAGPPIGAMLGQFGVNIMQFCKDFNSKSSIYKNTILLSVKLYVLKDGSYYYNISIPTLAYFLSKVSFQNTISIRWIYEIAKIQKLHIVHYQNTPIRSIVKNIIGTINVIHKYKIII